MLVNGMFKMWKDGEEYCLQEVNDSYIHRFGTMQEAVNQMTKIMNEVAEDHYE